MLGAFVFVELSMCDKVVCFSQFNDYNRRCWTYPVWNDYILSSRRVQLVDRYLVQVQYDMRHNSYVYSSILAANVSRGSISAKNNLDFLDRELVALLKYCIFCVF